VGERRFGEARRIVKRMRRFIMVVSW